MATEGINKLKTKQENLIFLAIVMEESGKDLTSRDQSSEAPRYVIVSKLHTP
jgi:hypothetical protein